jgi:Dolichyl-phosphate-mannose-protein mannosyltransferase
MSKSQFEVALSTSPDAAITRGPSTWRALLAMGIIICAFVALGTIIAVKTPAWESADEPGHVQNIETLASGHWYTMTAPCRLEPRIGLLQCSGDEAVQAPLYYLLFAGWQRLIGLPARAPLRTESTPYTSVNPAYFSGQSGLFLDHSPADLRFLIWLRIPNVILGALTVLVTYFAVRQITTDEWTPVVAASFVASLPRMVFLSSFVTNDNLVNLLGAVLTLLALRYAASPSRWRMAAVGAVFGLLVTTKLTTLPVALVLVVLACLVPGWKRRASLLGVGAVAALGVSSWYLIQNVVRYGDPFGRRTSAHYLILLTNERNAIPYAVPEPLKLAFFEVPEHVIKTFFYQSGWNQFQWSWPVTLLFTLVFVGALVGLIHCRAAGNTLVTLGVIALGGLLCVWVEAFQSAWLTSFNYYARYAFVGLAAIAALVGLGVERWRLPLRFLLPAMGLIGTLVAIQQDVLAVHWT